MPTPQRITRTMTTPLGSREATLRPTISPSSPRRSQAGRHHRSRTAAIQPHASRSNAFDWSANRAAPAVSGESSHVGNCWSHASAPAKAPPSRLAERPSAGAGAAAGGGPWPKNWNTAEMLGPQLPPRTAAW